MGVMQDKDGDGKAAWYPSNPNDKPPVGAKNLEPVESDTPAAQQGTDNKYINGSNTSTQDIPSYRVTSPEELKAEIDAEFQNMFGINAPKEVVNSYVSQLRAMETKRPASAVKNKAGTAAVYTEGPSAQQRRDLLSSFVKAQASVLYNQALAGNNDAINGIQKGVFGATLTRVKQAYADNGLTLDPKTLFNTTTDSMISSDKLNANLNLINLQAKTIFPALSDKIDQGYTVKQLLTPYISARANILEEDPDSIDIKKLAPIAKDPKNLMNLYDYEVSLRQDPKWRFTKNAQDNLSNVAASIAEMFGLVK